MYLLRLTVLLLLSSPALASSPMFVQCYDFGCKNTREFSFGEHHWREIRQIFSTGIVDSDSEKQAIRRAIATMERISGELTGTHQDKGGNWPGYDIPRQMDCIDESTNTFQYLVALDDQGLLKWHRADRKYRRIVWFITHWTAAVVENDSGEIFAVDSWYLDNGEMPYIQPLADWRRERSFEADYNPEIEL